MAERSRSHTTWHSNLLLLPYVNFVLNIGMNCMFGKLVLLGSVVAVSLLVASSVQAEGGCPDGYYPLAGGCAPIPDTPRTNPQPNRPDVPTRRRPRVPTMYANSYCSCSASLCG